MVPRTIFSYMSMEEKDEWNLVQQREETRANPHSGVIYSKVDDELEEQVFVTKNALSRDMSCIRRVAGDTKTFAFPGTIKDIKYHAF